MKGNEKLRAFFHKEKAELPCIEWATWWNLTLDRWHTEGLDPALTGEEMKKHFGLDSDIQVWVSPIAKNAPRTKQNGYINNEADYENLLPYLYSKEAFLHTWGDRLLQIRHDRAENGSITWFTLEGFFWLPRELFGIEDHFYSFYDEPALYHRICSDLTTFYLFVIDEITKYLQPEFMTFAEDMSYNLGPMLSEETFNAFILPYYQRIIPILKEKNIKVFVDSDGDITKMLPWLIRAGVDGILPLERQAGVDINVLTAQYPDFFFIGGFDKMVMKFGEHAIRQEFERILPAMKRRNYLPSVDHQTPPDVPLATYYKYIELLKEYCKKAAE